MNTINYQDTFEYLALQDPYTKAHWHEDPSVTQFIKQFRAKVTALKGVEEIGQAWKKAYEYAKEKQNIFLYYALRKLNTDIISSGYRATSSTMPQDQRNLLRGT